MGKSTLPSDIFPDRLREAREMRGFSQGELADRSGLQSSAISHFETKKRKPSFDNLRKLADALDVSTDFLLGRVDNVRSMGSADQFHRHLDNLSDSDQEIAKKMLEMLAERNVAKKEK